jgi:hypothetical protein
MQARPAARTVRRVLGRSGAAPADALRQRHGRASPGEPRHNARRDAPRRALDPRRGRQAPHDARRAHARVGGNAFSDDRSRRSITGVACSALARTRVSATRKAGGHEDRAVGSSTPKENVMAGLKMWSNAWSSWRASALAAVHIRTRERRVRPTPGCPFRLHLRQRSSRRSGDRPIALGRTTSVPRHPYIDRSLSHDVDQGDAHGRPDRASRGSE